MKTALDTHYDQLRLVQRRMAELVTEEGVVYDQYNYKRLLNQEQDILRGIELLRSYERIT